MSGLGLRRATPLLSGHDDIAAIIGREIVSGERAAGSRMPSAPELFERFGVSRVLLREVTKTLAAKGLVAAKSRIGTQILDSSHWNWFDPDVLRWRVEMGLDQEFLGHLSQIRRAIEPTAAAFAAHNRTAEDLDEMFGTLEAMAAADGDRRRFAAADLDFHVAVSGASGNPLFRSLAAVIEAALSASFTISSPADSAGVAEIVARHRAIADAIEMGDAPRAAEAMLCVIDEGLSRIDLSRTASREEK
jgi:DNA-binding FadR family transcriptional regulator